ncbi:serine hydrolase-like protein [Galendromus occidentalis]|uniref:Serine hydrolase-like protein n=1 Tax=Galendromus occidentalis TaxID=34638 RepID=A0AAJ6QVD3_9ACAR|nr:serine hydrolase-like protein [Galendromus occidentalis]
MQQPREVQFQMPWGHLAGQEWGDPKSRRKVLAIHGWMDNSNSFSKLCPLLPSDLHIIAIDLSGHGLSSHRPYGSVYTVLEFAIDMKRLADVLGWGGFAILAHSMGAMTAFLLAGLFPEMVTHIVSLDMLTILSCKKTLLPELTAKNIHDFLAFEKKHSQAPVYKNFDEVVDRRMYVTPHSLSRQSAEIIMRRATMDYQGGVVLRTDPRLKFIRILNYDYEAQEQILKRYKGKLLVILAKHEENRRLDGIPYESFVNTYKENCEDFNLLQVKGTHTVHLDEPEKVAGSIIEFLATYEGAAELTDKAPDSRL